MAAWRMDVHGLRQCVLHELVHMGCVKVQDFRLKGCVSLCVSVCGWGHQTPVAALQRPWIGVRATRWRLQRMQ